MMSKPFLSELVNIRPGNQLYVEWTKYALSLTREDMSNMVERGLTYQARALKDMVSEMIAGGAAPQSLFRKLDTLVVATERSAGQLRG
jgi:hypothetical protein